MSENRTSRRDSGPDEKIAQIHEHHQKKQDEEDRFRKMWEEYDGSEEGEEIDPEKFLRDMAILDELNPLPDFDMSSSWTDFEEKYGYLLEALDSADKQSSASESADKPKRRRRVKPMQLFLSVVAILAVLAVASSCGVIEYIIQAFAKWSDEVFHYEVTQEIHTEDVIPENTDITYYVSLEDALEAYGITTAHVPTWYPEGYSFTSVLVRDLSDATKLFAKFTRGQEEILLSIWHYKDSTSLELNAAEKLPPNANLYISGNHEHYILDNTETITTTWISDTEMYILAGPVNEHQIKQMIDSIYKGIA